MGIAVSSQIVQANNAQNQNFNISANPLNQVLNQFAAQTGVAIAMNGKDLSMITSQGLQGNYSVEQGFAKILQNTKYKVQKNNTGYVIVEKMLQEQNNLTPRNMGTLNTLDVNTDATMTTASVAQLPVIFVNAQDENSYTVKNSATATKLNLSFRETPQSTSVITQQKIQDFNLNNVVDVLEQTPGITVFRAGTTGSSIYARGLSINDIQINGSNVSSNTSYSNYGLTLQEMGDIEQVEVLKGSAGLLTGLGNPSAVVNLIKKKPTHFFQASTHVDVGSWDSYKLGADISGPLSADGTLRGRTAFSYNSRKSYTDYFSESNSMIFGALDFDLTPDTLINASISYKTGEVEGGANSTGIRAYRDGQLIILPRSFNANARWASNETNSLNTTLSIEQNLSTNWKAKLNLSYINIDVPEINRADVWGVSNLGIGRWEQKDETKSASLDINGTFELFGNTHEILFGASVNSQDWWLNGQAANSEYISWRDNQFYPNFVYEQWNGDIPKPSGWVPSFRQMSKSLNRAAYIVGRFSILEDLKLITGARVTDYSTRSLYHDIYDGANEQYPSSSKETGVLTPYAGIVYDLNDIVSVYGSYASIFKPQSAQDEYGTILDPEEGLTYEAGIKGEFFDKNLNVSLAHFWMQTDNYAEATDKLTPSGSTAYRTVLGATRRGYEFEISGKITPRLNIQGGYTMQNSNIEKWLPKTQFKLSTSYDDFGDIDGLTIGFATRWQDDTVYTSSDLKLGQKAFWVMDLMGRYQINPQLLASVNIANLLDKHYYNGYSTSYYTWGEPRNITASLKYNF